MAKCPICGGGIADGFCVSCGYKIPDEDAVAAPYNCDPADYMHWEDISLYDENEEMNDIQPPQEDISVKEEPDEWAEMDCISVPSQEAIGKELIIKPRKEDAAPKPRTAVRTDLPPSPYAYTELPQEESCEEPRDAFTIFVQGFVYEVKQHWWKVLLILLIPAVSIFFGIYYMAKARGFRSRYERIDPSEFEFKPFFLGILYIVVGIGFMIEGWDPFGLSEMIMSFISRFGRHGRYY